MKGWVGLVGWPIADGLPALVVIHQLQVNRRTGKVRRPETDVLPLCHATKWQTRRQTIKTKQNFCYSHAIMRKQCMVIHINTELNKNSTNSCYSAWCRQIVHWKSFACKFSLGLSLVYSWQAENQLQSWNNSGTTYCENMQITSPSVRSYGSPPTKTHALSSYSRCQERLVPVKPRDSSFSFIFCWFFMFLYAQ